MLSISSSDDCWMSFNRSSDGSQVPDPQKFPQGFKAVSDFIHNLNMKSGLYTAKGPHTCQKRAASCLHEAQDAKAWASWGIDYVKVSNLCLPRSMYVFAHMYVRASDPDH